MIRELQLKVFGLDLLTLSFVSATDSDPTEAVHLGMVTEVVEDEEDVESVRYGFVKP